MMLNRISRGKWGSPPRRWLGAGLLALVLPAQAADWQVAADGTPAGPGTLADPYDLATALSGAVGQAGDTFWLRGGTYSLGHVNTRIRGAPGQPITFRPRPGEKPRVDGSLTIWDSPGHVIVRDFEWFNSAPQRVSQQTRVGFHPTDIEIIAGIQCYAPNCQFINLIIHDHSRHGIYLSQLSDSNLIHGCLIYNNGWRAPDNAEGHSLYIQGSSGTREASDNVLFNSAGVGMHAYDNGGQPLVGVIMEGNVAFNAGAIQAVRTSRDWIVGAEPPSRFADRIVFRNNLGYRRPGSATDHQVELGRAGVNGALTMTGNYLPLGLLMKNWTTATVAGNTIAPLATGFVVDRQQDLVALQAAWNSNVYASPLTGRVFRMNSVTRTFAEWMAATGYDTASTQVSGGLTGTKVFVRTNRFEPGRAHLVVYNWSGLSHVEVPVNSVLPPGAAFEVRNAQDYFAVPVLSGTFDGRPLTLPMTGLTVAAPLGDMLTPPPTGPTFNVFILLPADPSTNANTAPAISKIESQWVDAATVIGPLPFTVTDAETGAAGLVVTARSTNPGLLPSGGIVPGGAGTNRFLTLTPAPNRSGTATVIVAVSDGLLSSNIRFDVVVSAPTIVMTSPTSDMRHTAPATIDLKAEVEAHGHRIDAVRYYHGTSLIGEVPSPPYVYTLSGVYAGNYAVTARVAYGGTQTVASPPVNVVVTFPEPAAGLTLSVTSGTVTAPFTVTNGFITQPEFTSPAGGGRMTCPFFISTPGRYVVSAQVEAPHEGANSFFVNIDAEPADPSMIWDVPPTSAPTERVVSWRGNGSPTLSEHAPKVFTLSEGTHELIVRGREGGCRLGVISVASIDQHGTPPTVPVVAVASDSHASRASRMGASFTLTRSGNVAFPLPVAYLLGGSAINGIDYLAHTGSATIHAGNASAKVKVFPLPADRLVTARTLTLTVLSTAAYSVGSSGVATVVVTGNAVPISNVNRVAGGGISITWPGGKGRGYRLATTEIIGDPWIDRSNRIFSDGSACTFVDHEAGSSPQRFYTVYVVN